MLQFVQFAEVFLPGIIDGMEQDGLFKRLHDFLAFRFVGRLQVHADVVHALAVGNRNHDVLIHLSLILVDRLDDRHGNLSHPFGLALEGRHSSLEQHFGQIFLLLALELFFGIRGFHSQYLKDFHLRILEIGLVYRIPATVPNHVDNVHADAFAHQRVATLRVDHRTLLVHHIIVFQQPLTDTEVVLFHLLLCPFDRVGNHLVLNHLAFLEAKLVHHGSNAVGREQTHQVVFE